MRQEGLICLRENMPPIKITPRKQFKPGFICPTCKEKFTTQDEFKNHVVECAIKRYGCDVCDSTFKKLAYKNQHMKRYHNPERSQKKELDEEKEQSDSENEMSKSEDSNSENSDWDRESADIVLDGEEVEHASVSGVQVGVSEIKADERKVNDIRAGRMIRKRTNPDPVIAPVKKGVKTLAQKNEADVCIKKKDSKKDAEQVQDMCSSGQSSKVTKNSSSSTERIASQESQKQTLNLQFSVDQGSDMKRRQSFKLSVDEEEIISSSVIVQANRGLGVMEFNLGDFVSSKSVKPENINIKVDKGRLTMSLDTE